MAIIQEVTQDDLAELLDVAHWHGGRYFSAWCPFDQHDKPAFTVYNDGCYCLSCQQSYTIKYVYNFLTGQRPSKNPSVLTQRWTGTTPPWALWRSRYETWENMVEQAIENLQVFPIVGKYIYNRGITQDTIDAARLGVVDDWVVFPCFDGNNNLVDMTVRNITTKYFGIRPRKEGEKTHLFVPDWERLRKHNTVLLPFGMFDCLTCYEAGAATLTGISGKQFQVEMFDHIQKRIVVIPDYNEYEGAVKLVRGLGWRGRLLSIPWHNYSECKDLNDIHMKFGLEEVKKLISV